VCEDNLIADINPQNLSSPFYPRLYRSKVNCVWTIRAPSANDVILIRFFDFRINHNVELKVSDFKLHNGEGSKLNSTFNLYSTVSFRKIFRF